VNGESAAQRREALAHRGEALARAQGVAAERFFVGWK